MSGVFYEYSKDDALHSACLAVVLLFFRDFAWPQQPVMSHGLL